jgi:hypothetical protein
MKKNKTWLIGYIFSGNPLKRYFLLSFLILLVFSPGIFSQTRESLVKAGYIEKFTHFIQWPETLGSKNIAGNFTIAVIGKNLFGKDLEELFSQTKVKESQVKIIYISSVDEIVNCEILFISESEKNNLEKILDYTSGKPILTISDSNGFGLKGVIINMFSEGGYIRYEVNRKALDKTGLKINSLLLNHALIIN